MKRMFIATLAAIVGLTVAQSAAQTPALPTADQVLEKYIAAIGGRAALEKITSRVAKGTLEIADVGVSGSIQISEKAPDKALTIVELAGMGAIREGTDGSGAWEENPQTGLRDKAGSELADAKRGATFNAELKMKTIYKTLQVTGKEKVGTRDAYALVATPADGTPTKMYFDVETGLMVRQAVTRETPQGPIDVDVFLEDYRDVEGTKQPFMVRQVTSAFSMVIRITEIKQNVALDDAIFKRPGAPGVAR